MQFVTQAIKRSISHNEIAHIRADDAGRAGASVEAIVAELSRECKGEALNKAYFVHEFWGVNVDGEEWRVHVALPGEAS